MKAVKCLDLELNHGLTWYSTSFIDNELVRHLLEMSLQNLRDPFKKKARKVHIRDEQGDAQDKLKFSATIKLRKKHCCLKGIFCYAQYNANVKERCAQRLWRYRTPKGEGSWSFLFLGQLLLDMLRFLFSFSWSSLCKSSHAAEIRRLMEQMVEVLGSGTRIVMPLNAKHQEQISQAVNLT